MKNRSFNKPLHQIYLPLGILLFSLFSCNLPETEIENLPGTATAFAEIFATLPAESPEIVYPTPFFDPNQAIFIPTPDLPHTLPDLRVQSETYYVEYYDTLGLIAQEYGITIQDLIDANQLINPDLLSVGQALVIPAPIPSDPASSFKIIPDSELVYGPLAADFDIQSFLDLHGGYLASYTEEVHEDILSGAEIVQRVATNNSVNPRLLLAVLDFTGGWVTQAEVSPAVVEDPFNLQDPWLPGLYFQLSWAADQLNRGFYLWRVGALGGVTTRDAILIPENQSQNAGTIGVHYLFSQLQDEFTWRQTVSENGFILTFQNLFNYPFFWAVEPLVPPTLSQPELQLPFEPGVVWNFTGGPHGGWDNGSGWAAIDFAPPMELLGCWQSDAWVVAVADGWIVRSENGAVVLDLDGDANEHTGWTIFYMHIETRDRVAAGTYVQSGDRIGHPSCEGGVSTGTHLHIARRYNGEWIPADGPLPFVMDGWTSVGTGNLYDGYLINGSQQIEACECQDPINQIQR